MTVRTMDQVRADHVSAMGDELGPAFYELHRKLVEIHLLWQQYRDLFGKDAGTVELLNRTAGLFFKVVQDEIWDSVLLAISRMTDPPTTSGRKNLTLRSLPPLIADLSLRSEVEALCSKATDEALFAREHRNKRIAHQDHGYMSTRGSNSLSGVSRSKVESMLSCLREVLNRIDTAYRGSTTMYQDFVSESGANLLVSKLRKLERLESKTPSKP